MKNIGNIQNDSKPGMARAKNLAYPVFIFCHLYFY